MNAKQPAGHGLIAKGLNAGLMPFALIMALAVSFAAQAQLADYSELETQLAKALSSATGAPITVTRITATPASELLEVSLSNGLTVYSTPDGKYFVVGDLYAVKPAGLVNLAEQKREAERKLIIDGVNIDDMVVFSPEGETRDYITVFTDVTCFYCQKLHKEVDDLNRRGIEVRYLAYPRAGLDSDGAKQLATAWCADDPQATLTKLKAGVSLPLNACADAPIAAQFQLGGQLGVRGTPAIITSGGQMIPGYRSAADLEQILGLN